jgi:S-methylmethionine-dependent homocysteine/selenocysteine methylase
VAYRDHLPQLDGGVFVTDGGLETSLIFNDGIDLPLFAAFDLLKGADGTAALRRYYEPYMDVARRHGLGFVLESPTWRSNPEWGAQLGYSAEALGDANRTAIALMEELRTDLATDGPPVVVSGCIGPHGDGYSPETFLSAGTAEHYHSMQVHTFAGTTADMVCAITMTYAEEAIGIAAAAESEGIPSAISFTVETDGRLPSGQGLGEAIDQVDRETGGAPAYYMVNCAHPTHFADVLDAGAPWLERVRGIRANASTRSHAELDEAEDLDAGDPVDLAARYVDLGRRLPSLNVLGGCCGTDHRHVGAICDAWMAA